MNAEQFTAIIKSLNLKSDGGSKPTRWAWMTNGECLALLRPALLQATLPSHSLGDLNFRTAASSEAAVLLFEGVSLLDLTTSMSRRGWIAA